MFYIFFTVLKQNINFVGLPQNTNVALPGVSITLSAFFQNLTFLSNFNRF